jgi:hypothetical protein
MIDVYASTVQAAEGFGFRRELYHCGSPVTVLHDKECYIAVRVAFSFGQ